MCSLEAVECEEGPQKPGKHLCGPKRCPLLVWRQEVLKTGKFCLQWWLRDVEQSGVPLVISIYARTHATSFLHWQTDYRAENGSFPVKSEKAKGQQGLPEGGEDRRHWSTTKSDITQYSACSMNSHTAGLWNPLKRPPAQLKQIQVMRIQREEKWIWKHKCSCHLLIQLYRISFSYFSKYDVRVKKDYCKWMGWSISELT